MLISKQAVPQPCILDPVKRFGDGRAWHEVRFFLSIDNTEEVNLSPGARYEEVRGHAGASVSLHITSSHFDYFAVTDGTALPNQM